MGTRWGPEVRLLLGWRVEMRYLLDQVSICMYEGVPKDSKAIDGTVTAP